MNQSSGRGITIGWKVASLAASIASVRYRAVLPALALEEAGLTCRVFSDIGHAGLDSLDVLVIVKSFSPDDFLLVQQAATQGVPVVLDLCDNIFIDSYGVSPIKARTSPAQMFLAMARLATVVVTTTEPLADVLRSRLTEAVPVFVAPDGLETKAVYAQIRDRLAQARQIQQKTFGQRAREKALRIVRRVRSLRTTAFGNLTRRAARRVRKELHWKPWAKRAYRRFDRLRTSMRAGRSAREAVSTLPIPAPASVTVPAPDPSVQRILWFGNHGGPHARFGMLDLLEIREALETVASEFKVELVVVSNNAEKYAQNIKGMRIPSSYLEWSPAVVRDQLSLASVVILPNTRDPFSLCKSANRTATALDAGVPVVATSTRALDGLRDCILLDDFLAGLRTYLGDPARARADVKKGREAIERLFGQQAIALAWRQVIDHALSVQGKAVAAHAEFGVALSLIQDLDLALPILLQAMRAGVPVVALCNMALVRSSTRLAHSLQEHGIEHVFLAENFYLDKRFRLPPKLTTLLTVTESNLAPHTFTRQLTEIANASGIFTATLQHGFENVGLTYDDEFQAADKIDFASRRVYLWGGPETLHFKVRAATVQKCVPAGCPKPASIPKASLDGVVPAGTTVIGVFENLHWRRYSNEYRQFFLDAVQALAHRFPEVLFLVKPHHAGLWLTKRFEGDAPQAANILIADPLSPAWAPYTAPSLLGHLRAVITTPSTVALDAARHGLPVAVVAHGMALENYAPLPTLENAADCEAFVRAALDLGAHTTLLDRSAEFVDRVLVPGNAAERIVKDMVKHAASGLRRAA